MRNMQGAPVSFRSLAGAVCVAPGAARPRGEGGLADGVKMCYDKPMQTTAMGQKPAAAEPAKAPGEPKKKKKGSFLRGCLLIFLALVLLVAGVAASALGLPRKLGLVKSKVEKAYDVHQADRYAAEDLRAVMAAEGLSTKGMDVYVLPLKDGKGSGAYVVLDESAGFSFNASGDGDPILDTLAAMAKSEAAKSGGLTYAAFEYKDAKGRSLITIGASVQDGADFADGKITQEQFMAKVGGKADLQNVSAAIQDMLK